MMIIFLLRSVVKYIGKDKKLYVVFMDVEQVYDWVDRRTLRGDEGGAGKGWERSVGIGKIRYFSAAATPWGEVPEGSEASAL